MLVDISDFLLDISIRLTDSYPFPITRWQTHTHLSCLHFRYRCLHVEHVEPPSTLIEFCVCMHPLHRVTHRSMNVYRSHASQTHVQNFSISSLVYISLLIITNTTFNLKAAISYLNDRTTSKPSAPQISNLSDIYTLSKHVPPRFIDIHHPWFIRELGYLRIAEWKWPKWSRIRTHRTKRRHGASCWCKFNFGASSCSSHRQSTTRQHQGPPRYSPALFTRVGRGLKDIGEIEVRAINGAWKWQYLSVYLDTKRTHRRESRNSKKLNN